MSTATIELKDRDGAYSSHPLPAWSVEQIRDVPTGTAARRKASR